MRSVQLLGVACGLLYFCAESTTDVEKSFHLYHKLGSGGEQTRRGTIDIAPDDDGILQANFSPDESSTLDTDAFDAMVDSGDLYTIAVKQIVRNTDAVAPTVSTSVPGCSVRRSNLREDITIFISPTGNLQSVTYSPNISPLAPKTCEGVQPLSKVPASIFGRSNEDIPIRNAKMPFRTTVGFDSHKPMMAIPQVLPQSKPPPGLKWYRRNAKNNPDTTLGGQTQHANGGMPYPDEEQPSSFKSTFLYRYWYLILPLTFVVLFSGADEGEKEKPLQSSAADGTAAAASQTHKSQRRGKRE